MITTYLDTSDAELIAYTRAKRAEARAKACVTLRASGATYEFKVKITDDATPLRRGSYRRIKQMLRAMRKRNCYLCGIKLSRKLDRHDSYTVDHKTPLSRGGADMLHNMEACCLSCNNDKGSFTEPE